MTVHAVSLWLLVAAFFGAGVFNAIGTPGTQSDFARWGYPRWWNRLTGGLEMIVAVLIALPGSRDVGLVLGAVIVVAAVLTVLRHRDFSHLLPLSVFGVLLAVMATLS
ncbi:DoxX family protein [Lichenihabitans psoromatis]|uniref:DoxX family protein n=1 Tax=Lichenihabitans psoromatis TaxID=2528642 RepID=UPI0010356C12|nr:DoxX family protein [Lichenihabitans psoromatis]